MKPILLALLIMSSPACLADRSLVISGGISIQHPDPSVMSHANNLLVLKFDKWHFSHEVVDPTRTYSGMDLTGFESEFFLSLFDEKARENLPGWLAVLSADQAKILGITAGKPVKVNLGRTKLRAIYRHNESSGDIFVFEKDQIHRLSFSGPEDTFNQLVRSIKER